jgi:chondroitin AC lyase
MKRSLLLFSFLLIRSISSLAQTEYETIMDRVRTDVLSTVSNVTTLDNGVTSTLATLQSNGSWPDVNYAYSSTTYTADVHLTRVKNFVLAYSHTSSTHYHSTPLFNAIVSSLGYWDTADPQSWNWYHNQISNPQMLGEILILLNNAPSTLSTTLRNNLLSQMNRGNPAAQAGANKLDIAIHFIYRACLTANDSLMQTGVTEAFYPILLTAQEGIQHDLSYQQHGPQLYLYGYGLVFVNGEIKVAHYLRGTSYALSGSKLALFSNFVRNAYLKVLRGKYIDFSVHGRSISRVNNLTPGIATHLNKLKMLDTAHVVEYNAAIARIQNTQPVSYMVTPVHTHFWRSDYTVHHRSGYFFGLRNVSTRTSKSENGNGENLKGYYLTEGATNISVNGPEYNNIFPVWDWSRIPGTTTPYLTTIPLRTAWGGNYGTAAFSGGVSDSLYGATALAFNDYNTQARKAWFFFDNEIVCLGANINSTAAEAINTTVNQCLLNGTVTVSAGGTESTLPAGSYSYNNNLKWVSHNGLGYYFPAGGNIQLRSQTQTGTWKSINNGGTTTVQSMNVFSLWFDHGVQPANASYAYYVIPGQNIATYDTSAVRILQNDADVQAVRHTGLNNWQLVFYKAGTFNKDGVTITVDRPCVLMLKQVGSTSVTVSIADPTQSSLPVNVYLTLPNIPQTRHLACTLPSGTAAGSSVAYTVNLSTPVYEASLITAMADAYVRNGSSYAGTNYGSATSLVLKKDTEGYTREVYFKFNVADIPATTDQVKLRLYVPYANTGVASVPWIVQYVSNDSWTESGINWNNKPISTSNVDTVNGRPSGNYAEWDVTSIAQAQQTADGTLSLKVIANATGSTTDASFSSRETGTVEWRPTLICTSGSSFLSSLAAETPAVQGIRIFPNPTSGTVRVETATIFQKAILHDVTGRQVSVEELGGRRRFELHLQHFKPGIYTLHLSGGGNTVVKKIVKL